MNIMPGGARVPGGCSYIEHQPGREARLAETGAGESGPRGRRFHGQGAGRVADRLIPQPEAAVGNGSAAGIGEMRLQRDALSLSPAKIFVQFLLT
jgi:hypothetical protein